MITSIEHKEFTKLLKSYKENGRTVEEQHIWLTEKHGYSGEIASEALRRIYKLIKAKTKFKDGHELDRQLLAICERLKVNNYKKVMVQEVNKKNLFWTWLNKPRGYMK